MRILYLIQIHKECDQLLSLLDLVYSADHAYLVSIDPSYALDDTRIIAFFEGRSHSRYYVRRSLPITWGGYSQVLAWVDLLSFACRSVPEWDVAINLSGECLPLAPPREVVRAIRHIDAEGVRVAFNRYYSAPWVEDRQQFNDRCFVRVDWLSGRRPPLVVKTRINNRVDAWIQPVIEPVFTDPDRNPVLHWIQRAGLHCTDAFGEKLLIVRGLFPHETRHRQKFLSEVRFAGGRAWFIMWRQFIEALLEDPEFFRIISEFEHTICPDEIAIQTYVATAASRGAVKVAPWNLHHADGNPLGVDDGMVDELLASKSVFVRKVDYRRCPLLVAAVTKRIHADR